MKYNTKEVLILILAIVSFTITQFDSCSEISILDKTKKLKTKVVTFEQFPKLKVFPRIDSVMYRLNIEKFLIDSENKTNGKIKQLVAGYFLELNYSQKILNVGANTGIIDGIALYFDTTYQTSLKEIRLKAKNNILNKTIESKFKFIEPSKYIYAKTSDTITYINNQFIWLNLFIIYKNSSSIQYYKYFAAKLKFENYQIPIDYMNSIKKVATDIRLPEEYVKIVEKIEYSNSISKLDLNSFDNFINY